MMAITIIWFISGMADHKYHTTMIVLVILITLFMIVITITLLWLMLLTSTQNILNL